ncbi:MAG: hypothetical protein H8E81_09710 [Deltaproteobacteria bacterium]|nr:hypothetical protein [Deltaproteobacteria bacterium]
MRLRSNLFRTLVALCAAALVCLCGVKLYADQMAGKKLKSVAAKMFPKTDVSWKDVDVRFLSPDLVVQSISFSLKNGRHAKIDRIIIDDFNVNPMQPNSAVVRVRGLCFPVDEANFGNRAPGIREFGYQTISTDLDLDISYNQTGHSLVVNSLGLSASDVGELRLRLVLDHFFPKRLKNMEMESLVIREARLEYRDRSILKKMTLQARQNEKALIDFLIHDIEQDIAKARKESNEPVVRSITELKSFLEDPQKLSVKMKLLKPVNLGHILTSKKISDLLGLIHYRFSTE